MPETCGVFHARAARTSASRLDSKRSRQVKPQSAEKENPRLLKEGPKEYSGSSASKVACAGKLVLLWGMLSFYFDVLLGRTLQRAMLWHRKLAFRVFASSAKQCVGQCRQSRRE